MISIGTPPSSIVGTSGKLAERTFAHTAKPRMPRPVFDLRPAPSNLGPVAPEIVSPDIGIIWSADRAGAMVSALLNAVRAEAAAARRDSPGLRAVSSRAAKNPSAPHASA